MKIKQLWKYHLVVFSVCIGGRWLCVFFLGLFGWDIARGGPVFSNELINTDVHKEDTPTISKMNIRCSDILWDFLWHTTAIIYIIYIYIHQMSIPHPSRESGDIFFACIHSTLTSQTMTTSFVQRNKTLLCKQRKHWILTLLFHPPTPSRLLVGLDFKTTVETYSG